MKRLLAVVAILALSTTLTAQTKTTKYVRYAQGTAVSYGLLEGDTIRQLSANLFESPKPTGKTVKMSEVKLLAPVEPSKVIAVGLNYQSHLGQRSAAAYPGLFAKYPTSIIANEENIIYPADATNLHFEGEVVVVIGKKASKVSEANAKNHIFGITAGNDVSERDWQQKDLQWFRAKASDTFGPLGPVIVQGLNYNDLQLQTRLNGQVVQSARTKDLIFSIDKVVSYISQYVTLMPGDVIYTGTPGTTKAMKPGDVVEVEVEGVGILRNKIAAAPATSNQ